MKKFVILMILLCLFVTGCSSNKEEDNKVVRVESITTNEVKRIIDNYDDEEDIVIIDVRTENEYNAGHLEEAINIPVGNIESIDINKDVRIVVYCRSGSRSATAASKLIELGYEKVYDMGGIQNWEYELVDEDE